MQTTSTSAFEELEKSLRALAERVAEVPFNEILLCRLLLHMGREVGARFEQQIRPFGLAEAEFRVLTTLFSQPRGLAHPGDLCTRAAQSPANMSRICDALVERGHITRVPSSLDRRRMDLRITEQGEAAVRDLLPQLFYPLRTMLSGFTAEDQAKLVMLLKRLHGNLAGAGQESGS